VEEIPSGLPEYKCEVPAEQILTIGKIRAVQAVWPLDFTPASPMYVEAAMAAPKILVVDDEKSITLTLTLILQNAGFDVATANDGVSGLDAIRRLNPDLLLSDVVMPGMNGIELAMHARAIAPSCRVLLFSGQAVTHDLLREARALGHEFELLHKPVHPEELLERIHSIFHDSSAANAAHNPHLARMPLPPAVAA
jgi:DNA-binding response OmpR family regulator